MRRPEWAAAGTFYEAWREAVWTQQESMIDWHKLLARTIAADLATSHVLTMDAAQIDALPNVFETYADSAAAFVDVKLPFDPVYISTDRVLLDRFAYPVYLLGALVERPPNMKRDYNNEHMWDGRQPFILPLIEMSDLERPFWPGYGLTHPDRRGWQVEHMLDHVDLSQFSDSLTSYVKDSRTVIADAAEQIVKIIYFLESSNVELVEGPASRQEKRHVARKGGKIALTVQVRAPKRRVPSGAPAAHVDYSHRWEVRGHYKHFPVGTRLADAAPEKLVDHETLGRCRRVWCPPFVKGPQDKPLVPKIRVVS